MARTPLLAGLALTVSAGVAQAGMDLQLNDGANIPMTRTNIVAVGVVPHGNGENIFPVVLAPGSNCTPDITTLEPNKSYISIINQTTGNQEGAIELRLSPSNVTVVPFQDDPLVYQSVIIKPFKPIARLPQDFSECGNTPSISTATQIEQTFICVDDQNNVPNGCGFRIPASSTPLARPSLAFDTTPANNPRLSFVLRDIPPVTASEISCWREGSATFPEVTRLGPLMDFHYRGGIVAVLSTDGTTISIMAGIAVGSGCQGTGVVREDSIFGSGNEATSTTTSPRSFDQIARDFVAAKRPGIDINFAGLRQPPSNPEVTSGLEK